MYIKLFANVILLLLLAFLSARCLFIQKSKQVACANTIRRVRFSDGIIGILAARKYSRLQMVRRFPQKVDRHRLTVRNCRYDLPGQLPPDVNVDNIRRFRLAVFKRLQHPAASLYLAPNHLWIDGHAWMIDALG